MTSPLRSHALGASLAALVAPCHDRLRPAHPRSPESGPAIGLTFSGGGFRATFAALGIIRYLADAQLLGNVRYVSSVSGGSVANGVLATNWADLREAGYSSAAVDDLVIAPITARVAAASLRTKVIRNVWRAVGTRSRTDVLAWALDEWLFDGRRLEDLDPEVRWIINAANLATGSRFAFERDVVGDYVNGLAPTHGTGLSVAQAVAASAAVPGVLAPVSVRGIDFPCADVADRGHPLLVDGGTYDNTGLEPLMSDRYRDVFLISINAGGVFVTRRIHGLPIIRDLARSNSLLYRQSTGLRTRWMAERFRSWNPSASVTRQLPHARNGVLFGLATNVGPRRHGGVLSADFQRFAARFPEYRTYRNKDLAFVPTVFNRLDVELLNALVYRGWWLTGATLAEFHPEYALNDDPKKSHVTRPPATHRGLTRP